MWGLTFPQSWKVLTNVASVTQTHSELLLRSSVLAQRRLLTEKGQSCSLSSVTSSAFRSKLSFHSLWTILSSAIFFYPLKFQPLTSLPMKVKLYTNFHSDIMYMINVYGCFLVYHPTIYLSTYLSISIRIQGRKRIFPSLRPKFLAEDTIKRLTRKKYSHLLNVLHFIGTFIGKRRPNEMFKLVHFFCWVW